MRGEIEENGKGIPREVWLMIFANLPLVEKNKIIRTCKLWNR
jgi:hypothetical protein